MKHVLGRLRLAPRLRWSDVTLTLLPALAWLAAVHARPMVMTLRCQSEPASCTREAVNSFDRWSVDHNSPEADSWSFTTQNTSGYLAFGIPLGLAVARIAWAGLSPATALAAAGTDLVITLQAVAWTGLATESARLLVQRPRPFVITDPAQHGANPASYTSFFSGHTSFASTASTSLALTLLGRAAPPAAIVLAVASGTALTGLTAFFRVFAGRHFVTDTLVGALAGFVIALSVALLHRPRA